MILGPYYKEGLLKLLIIFGVITTIGCHLGICVLRDPNSSAYYDCIMGLGYQNSTFLIQPTAN